MEFKIFDRYQRNLWWGLPPISREKSVKKYHRDREISHRFRFRWCIPPHPPDPPCVIRWEPFPPFFGDKLVNPFNFILFLWPRRSKDYFEEFFSFFHLFNHFSLFFNDYICPNPLIKCCPC